LDRRQRNQKHFRDLAEAIRPTTLPQFARRIPVISHPSSLGSLVFAAYLY